MKTALATHTELQRNPCINKAFYSQLAAWYALEFRRRWTLEFRRQWALEFRRQTKG